MPLAIKPLHPRFAAEISGVDIAQPLNAAVMREIIAANRGCRGLMARGISAPQKLENSSSRT